MVPRFLAGLLGMIGLGAGHAPAAPAASNPMGSEVPKGGPTPAPRMEGRTTTVPMRRALSDRDVEVYTRVLNAVSRGCDTIHRVQFDLPFPVRRRRVACVLHALVRKGEVRRVNRRWRDARQPMPF